MRRIEIVPWTEEWHELYHHKEASILKSIFSQELLEIHHIGSTSIPQIKFAKPIIDILMVVKAIHKPRIRCKHAPGFH